MKKLKKKEVNIIFASKDMKTDHITIIHKLDFMEEVKE